MAGYLVLARKYRSTTFDELVGQGPIATTLVNAIKSERVAHAYLFTGTRGVGKTTMARILAKAMNCLAVDEPTPTPCGKCDACVAIGRGDDVDVVEIDGASNRGIDEIRQLRANAILSPARSRFKVYYIDEVHMLTKEAFNALLKTLEEPPGHVKFIFSTTEVEKVPATIVSRCQRFDFRDISTRLIAEHLATICKAEKVKADDDALFRIARAAAGSMRDGLSLLDQLLASGAGKVADEDVVAVLGTPSDERMVAIVRAIAEGDSAAALGELAGVLGGGVTLPVAAAALGDVFRNMMIASTCGADTELIELPDTQRKAVAELAARFDTPALVQAVGMLQVAGRAVRTSSLARALLEAVVVRLAEAEKFIGADAIIERLENLAGGKGGLPGQKKNPPLTGPGTNSATGSAQGRLITPTSAPARPAMDVQIQWEADWLSANWAVLIESLLARRQMQVAGALRAASVAGFADDTLKLTFDTDHETLRARCAGPMYEAVCSALTQLAPGPIRCEFVSSGKGGAGGAAAAQAQVLSTADKNEISKDPAVQAVMGLFGGEIIDMQKDPNAPQPAEENDTTE